MSLKNEIEKEMFTEGLQDRIQDIATFIDVPADDVENRLKTLSFSDYVEIMTAYKTKDAALIKKTMGLEIDVDESKILEDREDREDRTDVADRLADLANSQITGYFSSEDELHDFMYSELTSDEDYHDGGKTIDWAMGRVNDDVKAWIDESVDEAYNTGSQGKHGSVASDEEYAGQEEPVGTTEPTDMATLGKVKAARIQAMQRLGRDNLGGATAAQAADAMDKAEQGKPLTPIQRQAMAYQAQNLDSLAGSPDTRIQFRNLLNRLRKQQQQQEQ